ncbi:MAG TPA: patatin-like phospholipase family protein [Solirubrobacterales bacterium]|nr:patatin-like phospholipase family protein [Solirubrobacterales bacterium]
MEVSHQSNRPGRSRDTLGRLGGLGPGEADRGEKALWLSGGGYRAALFHLGALTRLNELGLLGQLHTVGAVSGGSIMAALLATGVPWPLQGAYRDWPERVAEPLRAIARRNARARAFLRKPLAPGADAALEERYARELVESLGGEPARGPRFVFGGAGLTLAGLVHAQDERVEWDLAGSAHPPGYAPELVATVIMAVRTDLDAFGKAEQAVLENHGYLLADAAVRARGLARRRGIETAAPEPPHPRWMSEARVREALASSSRRTPLGRLRPRRPGRGNRRPEPGSAELAALLERYRPVLQYDSLESFRADAVETICRLVAPGRCNTLHRADGRLLASAAPSGEEPRLDLDFLTAPTYPSGEPARSDDYIDECGGSHAADALAMRQREGYCDVVYGRARLDEAERLWLQYFFFYYYDDKGMLGIAQHEGDWEMVQLRLDRHGLPEEATFAQHGGAERLRWEELELAGAEGGQAPVVYPARGSHSARPRPGTHAAPVVPDHNDGIGARVRPRLVPIADDGPGWLLWPGRWGSTRRRESFEGDSPRGPRGLPHWWDPEELHREARPWEDGGGGDRLARPPRPRVSARREGELAIVSYSFPPPRAEEGEPARIVTAPLAVGDAEPSAAHSLPVDGLEGSFAVQLPAGQEWMGVRVSAASDRGVPGETIAARLSGE